LGLFRTTSVGPGFENENFLRATDYDLAKKRGRLHIATRAATRVNLTSSRWQIQLGARYTLKSLDCRTLAVMLLKKCGWRMGPAFVAPLGELLLD